MGTLHLWVNTSRLRFKGKIFCLRGGGATSEILPKIVFGSGIEKKCQFDKQNFSADNIDFAWVILMVSGCEY